MYSLTVYGTRMHNNVQGAITSHTCAAAAAVCGGALHLAFPEILRCFRTKCRTAGTPYFVWLFVSVIACYCPDLALRKCTKAVCHTRLHHDFVPDGKTSPWVWA